MPLWKWQAREASLSASLVGSKGVVGQAREAAAALRLPDAVCHVSGARLMNQWHEDFGTASVQQAVQLRITDDRDSGCQGNRHLPSVSVYEFGPPWQFGVRW